MAPPLIVWVALFVYMNRIDSRIKQLEAEISKK